MTEGRFASYYDMAFEPFLKRIQRRILHVVKKYGCKNVVDTGCGTGMQTNLLYKNGIETMGVDKSDAMLKVAMKKEKEIPYLIADITSLPLANDSFHCAILSFIFHLSSYEKIEKIMEETKRVVEEGGILIITDYGFPAGLKGKIFSVVINTIENLAEKEHRKNYHKYMERGAISVLIKEFALPVLEKHSFYGGNIQTVVLKNSNP